MAPARLLGRGLPRAAGRTDPRLPHPEAGRGSSSASGADRDGEAGWVGAHGVDDHLMGLGSPVRRQRRERAGEGVAHRPSRGVVEVGVRDRLELRLFAVVADGDEVTRGEVRQPARRSEEGALGGSPGVVVGVLRPELGAAGQLDGTGQGEGDQVGAEIDGLPLQLGGGQPVGQCRPSQVVEHRGEPAVGKPPELVGLAGDERELLDEVVGVRPVAHQFGCQFGDLGRDVLGQRLDGQGPWARSRRSSSRIAALSGSAASSSLAGSSMPSATRRP